MIIPLNDVIGEREREREGEGEGGREGWREGGGEGGREGGREREHIKYQTFMTFFTHKPLTLLLQQQDT